MRMQRIVGPKPSNSSSSFHLNFCPAQLRHPLPFLCVRGPFCFPFSLAFIRFLCFVVLFAFLFHSLLFAFYATMQSFFWVFQTLLYFCFGNSGSCMVLNTVAFNVLFLLFQK
ncbi:hypothetical protein BJ138DRAFT_82227, partial [Hygrophoropsis aurantiaca]